MKRTQLFSILAIAFIGMRCSQPTNDETMTDVSVNVSESGPDNFNFLRGEWKIHNEVLNGRLVNATEWSEFPARLYGYQRFLNGHLNIEKFEAERNGEPFYASSIRVFNPDSREWIIYWVDSNNYEVMPQVTGSFENGIGTFYGEDLLNGQPVKLRFLWKDITENSAIWEQAYFDDRVNDWETNWIMHFERVN